MFPYFYAAVMPQYCPSVCPSVTFKYRDHICWNTSKIISPPNSDKIVMWRFLRNRRLLLCLHTIFRALKYWAHRAVVLAWHLVAEVTHAGKLFQRRGATTSLLNEAYCTAPSFQKGSGRDLPGLSLK